MNRRVRRPLVGLLTIALVLTLGQSALVGADTPGGQTLVFDGTQSQWAEPELQAAYQYGLTYPGILGNYQQPITREEFCTIVVKLYEKLTGQTATAGSNPFSDTANPEILKAYSLGIIKGTSATTFSPTNKITRQEICVMIFRALEASLPGLTQPADPAFPFSDAGTIASWAISAMKFAYANEIMKGVGDNKIAPLQNTSREQAIALVKRTFEKYSGEPPSGEELATLDAAVREFGLVAVQSGPALETDEKAKYFGVTASAFPPAYDTRLALYVSTAPGKPTQRPTLPRLSVSTSLFTSVLKPKGPVYTTSWGAFVDQDGDKKRWFAFLLDNAPGAVNVVWQVAAAPFNGTADNWKAPPGLLKSGTVPASAGEFQVDFGALGSSASLGDGGLDIAGLTLPIFTTSSYKPIPRAHRSYYVRAVPVDAGGNAIGDPGSGLAVVFGESTLRRDQVASAPTRYELWTPRSNAGVYSGEFKDKPEHRTEVGVDPTAGLPENINRVFHFHDLDPAVTEIVIQVSSRPFTSANNTPGAGGLLYEESYILPVGSQDVPAFYPLNDYPASVSVPFGQFGKKASEMKANDYIKYYVRGLALAPAATPGYVDVQLTDTVLVKYGFGPQPVFYAPPAPTYQYINLALPQLKLKGYSPIQWSAGDSLHRYMVYRAPTAGEITCCWKNTTTGEVLFPYDSFIGQPYYKAQGIQTALQYEQIVIPRVLKPGTLVYFPTPKEADKSWYEELWDGVVEFFEDLVSVVQDLVNQIATAYVDLKAGLIDFVADLCPIESLKGPFRTALEALVNTGLAAVGLPPTLPNFDDLTSLSLEYLAEVALTEAGVPASQMTAEVVGPVAAGIGQELQKAADRPAPNPVDAPFLQLDPGGLYRPAYVDVEIANDTDYPTVPGSFDLFVTFEFDYWTMYANSYDPDAGILFTCPNPYAVGSTAALTQSLDYQDHFLHGLNGDTLNFPNGDEAVYDVFAPVEGVKVPALRPHESTTVRVYVEPFTWHGDTTGGRFTRYPTGDLVSATDFEVMYFGNGNKKFTNFYLEGCFPTAAEYQKSIGLLVVITDPNTILTYKAGGPTSDAEKKPVLSAWTAP